MIYLDEKRVKRKEENLRHITRVTQYGIWVNHMFHECKYQLRLNVLTEPCWGIAWTRLRDEEYFLIWKPVLYNFG